MSKFFLFVCLAVCCSASLVAGRSLWWYHLSTRPQVQVSYSPELVQDMHEFIDLIPTAVIDELVAEHLIVDSGFRKAIKFLRSSDFKQLLQRIQLLPEVIEVINFLHLNDTAVRTTLRVDKRFELPWTPKKEVRKDYGYYLADPSSPNSLQEGVVVVFVPESQPAEVVSERFGTFVGFVQEILNHLPRDRFVALIKEKRQKGTVFPKFYEALRSDKFKTLVEKTMKSQNVINVLSTLASHDIDANALKGIAFEVISWGPSV